MKFFADNNLEVYVKKKKRGSYWSFVAVLLLFYIMANAFYYNTKTTTEYTIQLIISFLICISGIYSVTVMEGKKLNKLVKEMKISGEVTLYTYDYQFLFYNLPSQIITVNKNDLQIEETVFPFNSQGLAKNKTLSLTIEHNKLYVVYESFSEDLKSALII